jgi:hypothetical protein
MGPVFRRTRRSHGPVLPSLLVTFLVLGGVLLVSPGTSAGRIRSLVGLGDDRLLDAVRTTHGYGTYRFLRTQPGSREPVSYNPCRPITYVVNPAGAPPGYQALVTDSVAAISAATGFRFDDEGTTRARPFGDRGSPVFARSPVVIGWLTPEQEPRLEGDIAGVGGSTAVERSPHHLSFVTGAVALDRDVFADLAARDASGSARAILMHELGHVVGLAHVDDPAELMYAQNTGRAELGPGDREGLARLGSVDCP